MAKYDQNEFFRAERNDVQEIKLTLVGNVIWAIEPNGKASPVLVDVPHESHYGVLVLRPETEVATE